MPTPSLTIRAAAPPDFPETIQVYLECYRVDFPFLPAECRTGRDPEKELAGFLDWFETDLLNRAFVALDGDTIAGYIVVSRNVDEPFDYDGEINNFFVRPCYRGRGVGRALLQTAGRYFQQVGIQRPLVYCLHEGASAQYYRRRGARLLRQVTQNFSGSPQLVDILGWDLDDLLANLSASGAGPD